MQSKIRYLVCPQCGSDKLYLETEDGMVFIKIDWQYQVYHKDQITDVYSCDTLYCQGCSFKGSIRHLVKYIIQT